MIEPDGNSQASTIVQDFENQSGLNGVTYETKERSDGKFVTFCIYNPSERFYSILNKINDGLSEEDPHKDHLILKKKNEKLSLKSPEMQSLQLALSESLTVGQDSFADEFFSRYIDSGSGAEGHIQAKANHLVFGRRGAGKSSLLLYAMRKLEERHMPYAWVNLQVYEKRSDNGVVAEVLEEILEQLKKIIPDKTNYDYIRNALTQFKDLDEQNQDINKIRKLASKLKSLLYPITQKYGELTLFLDDLHIVNLDSQPQLLSVLYSFSRGNKIYLKISAVQNFTKSYDPKNSLGLHVPNDAQIIPLDLNLTNPNIAGEHIKNILDACASLSGAPPLATICNKKTISRLIWIAAGVPRDAISLFLQALTKSIQQERRNISITDVNLAASEVVEDKKRYLDTDSSGTYQKAGVLFERIKNFCVNEEKKNAFLVKIDSVNESYKLVLKLIDLRLLHILNRGITPDKAGIKYIALLLDYGFYVGSRLAKSVGIFQTKLQALKYNELRHLPKFNI